MKKIINSRLYDTETATLIYTDYKGDNQIQRASEMVSFFLCLKPKKRFSQDKI